MTITEIYEKITISYKNILLTDLPVFKKYGNFVCKVLESEEKHENALMLNSGSSFYHVLTLSLSAIYCVLYKNTDILDLIKQLNPEDLLIIDGKRAKFIRLGKVDAFGFVKDKEYFIYESNSCTNYCLPESLKNKNISRYNGSSERLDGRGVKSDFLKRKDFISYCTDKKKSEISTEIEKSIAVVCDRGFAEDVYNNVVIEYNGKKIKLSELVTAAYFSDGEKYQIGNNPTKEDPIIKFYSKISTLRDFVIDDNGKSLIGCVFPDESIWYNSSELSVSNRKSLKFSILEGKLNFVKFAEFISDDAYHIYSVLPEQVEFPETSRFDSDERKRIIREFTLFSKRTLNETVINTDWNSVINEIKKRLLTIQRQLSYFEGCEEYIINCYFLLNLCRSAYFPLKYCNIAFEKQQIGWTLDDKLSSLAAFGTETDAEIKEDIEYINSNISLMLDRLYYENPKANIIIQKIKTEKVDCIVTTKAYYNTIFDLWLNDENIERDKLPDVLTVSVFEKNRSVFSRVIFTTAYYDFTFNPYAEASFAYADLLIYDYEKYQSNYMKKNTLRESQTIYEKQGIQYGRVSENKETADERLQDNDLDFRFEKEIEQLTQNLQVKSANTYLKREFSKTDSLVPVAKILTFLSGNAGFFTKQFKAYRISGESIDETDLADLKVGDSIVFTKQSENKDIVDLLLNNLLNDKYKETDYPNYYKQSLAWKNEIRTFIESNNYSLVNFVDMLDKNGCSRSYAAVRSWLTEECHIVGPTDENDYKAILSTIGSSLDFKEVCKSCGEIRKLRRKILNLLGKAIIKNILSENNDPIWKEVEKNADDLSQIEQISSINEPEENAKVPVYMANKPCIL